MNTTHLIGAEQVERAGYNIQSAADVISRAAAHFEETVLRLGHILDEHAGRIEAAMSAPVPRKCMVSQRKNVPGTNRWETVERGPAMFIRWAEQFDEFENGVGNATLALVEFSDGAVETVLPDMIKFEVAS